MSQAVDANKVIKAMQDQLSESNLKVAILTAGMDEARERIAELEEQIARSGTEGA